MRIRGLSLVLVLALVSCLVLAAFSEQIDRCGWLSSTPFGCITFEPTNPTGFEHAYGTDLVALPESLLWAPVRIRGEIVYCQAPCPSGWACVTGAMIEECEPTDLGCGVLHEDPYDGCHSWISSVWGPFLTGMGGHSDGDTVGV
jgi:hypothetical protein